MSRSWTRPFALVRHDLRLQYRYGILAAYAFVVGFYVLILLLGRHYLPDWAIALVIYTDPAAVGFFFLGALMLLERVEGARVALAASPATSRQYLLGKLVTLTGLALAAALALLAVHARAPEPLLLLAATGLTSVAFIGIGVPIALHFATVNAYLMGSSVLLMPIIAPAFLALFDPMPLWLGLWPPVAQLRLMLIALGHASATSVEIALLLGVAALAALASLAWALHHLRRELGK